MSYMIYCLNYKNDERKNDMIKRFETLQLNYKMTHGLDECFKGHLLNITEFFLSDYEYGIFCEDDIYIHKDIKDLIHELIENYESNNLDVMLLGYLLNGKIERYPKTFSLQHQSKNFKYYNYTDDLWGTQMYMLNKKTAKYIINNYLDKKECAERGLVWDADWILTKFGKRHAIEPMIAVEDGKKKYNDRDQEIYHLGTTKFHYDPDKYI